MGERPDPKEFCAALDRDLSPKEHEQRPSSRLFHYTTAMGLKGIIESGELWRLTSCISTILESSYTAKRSFSERYTP